MASISTTTSSTSITGGGGGSGGHHHRTTIVLEFGSSRIRVGYAGESRPRRVLDASAFLLSSGGKHNAVVGIDGLGGGGCGEEDCRSYFRYLASPSLSSPSSPSSSAAAMTSELEWERVLQPLMTRILSSMLFVQLHSAPRHHRPRVLILGPDPVGVPTNFRRALTKVLLEYHKVGGVLFVNGAGFGTLPYLLDAMMPATTQPEAAAAVASSIPRACLIVDIGTEEARCAVAFHPATLDPVSSSLSGGGRIDSGSGSGDGLGQNFLSETYHVVSAGHRYFIRAVLDAYREEYHGDGSGEEEQHWTTAATMEDGRAIIRAWMMQMHRTTDETATTTTTTDNDATLSSIRVSLPCNNARDTNTDDAATTQNTTILPAAPIEKVFYDIYLNHAHPQSLVYALLSSAKECPVDLRRAALGNVLLVGGGSVALMGLGGNGTDGAASKNNRKDLCARMEDAVRTACGCNDNNDDENGNDGEEDEEKKEDTPSLSSIASRRFHLLRGAVQNNGIRVRHPAPFAPDGAAWVGGSVAGSLALERERWLVV